MLKTKPNFGKLGQLIILRFFSEKDLSMRKVFNVIMLVDLDLNIVMMMTQKSIL